MLGSEEGANNIDLTPKSLEHKVRGYNQSLDTVPVDPRTYTPLFQSEVSYQGKLYELVYKICKPTGDRVITKLSLIDSAVAKKPDFAEKITKRYSKNDVHSDDDYHLSEEEAAFRYLNMDLSKDPIEVGSRMEVAEDLQEHGLGTLLFNAYELLSTDIAGRLPEAQGKQLKLLVRDNSKPKGWTERMALRGRYQAVDPLFSGSSFPTFQKIVSSQN